MSEPRYGIWIPVYGNCGVMNHPLEPRDASYSRAKNLIQLAQRRGFTTTLIAQHIINPRNQKLDQLETWTAARQVAQSNDFRFWIKLFSITQRKLYDSNTYSSSLDY